MEGLGDNLSNNQEGMFDDVIILGEESENSIDGSSPQWEDLSRKQFVALISEFKGQKVIKACWRKFMQELWEDLHERLLTTKVEHQSSLKEYSDKIMVEILRIDTNHPSFLGKSLTNLFTEATEYDSSRSLSLEKMSQKTYTELRSRPIVHFSKIEAKESETSNRVQSLEEK